MKAIIFVCTALLILGACSGVNVDEFIDDEIEAWHFHTYFFEVNPERTDEALAFR